MTKNSEEEKVKWLGDWQCSGKSARVYAKESGINPQTFTKWTKRKEGLGFVESTACSEGNTGSSE